MVSSIRKKFIIKNSKRVLKAMFKFETKDDCLIQLKIYNKILIKISVNNTFNDNINYKFCKQ